MSFGVGGVDRDNKPEGSTDLVTLRQLAREYTSQEGKTYALTGLKVNLYEDITISRVF